MGFFLDDNPICPVREGCQSVNKSTLKPINGWMFVSKHKSLGFSLGFFVILVTRAAMTPRSTTAPTATSWILRSTQRATALRCLCWGCSPWAASMVPLETTDRTSRRCHSWQRRCKFKVPKHATVQQHWVFSYFQPWCRGMLIICRTVSAEKCGHIVSVSHMHTSLFTQRGPLVVKHGCGQPVRSTPKQPARTFETWLASMPNYPSYCGGGESKDTLSCTPCWKVEGKHLTNLACPTKL